MAARGFPTRSPSSVASRRAGRRAREGPPGARSRCSASRACLKRRGRRRPQPARASVAGRCHAMRPPPRSSTAVAQYLRAIQIRLQRQAHGPQKDQQKATQAERRAGSATSPRSSVRAPSSTSSAGCSRSFACRRSPPSSRPPCPGRRSASTRCGTYIVRENAKHGRMDRGPCVQFRASRSCAQPCRSLVRTVGKADSAPRSYGSGRTPARQQCRTGSATLFRGPVQQTGRAACTCCIAAPRLTSSRGCTGIPVAERATWPPNASPSRCSCAAPARWSRARDRRGPADPRHRRDVRDLPRRARRQRHATCSRMVRSPSASSTSSAGCFTSRVSYWHGTRVVASRFTSKSTAFAWSLSACGQNGLALAMSSVYSATNRARPAVYSAGTEAGGRVQEVRLFDDREVDVRHHVADELGRVAAVAAVLESPREGQASARRPRASRGSRR